MIQTIKNLYHLFQAISANIYFGFPSRKLKVIGITGTDGKTTTTHLLYHILKNSGHKVSMISSLYAVIGDKGYDTGFHVTTPDIFPLQRFLKKSLDNKDEYFVLETTSHAIDQNRVFGIRFYLGILTNITHEHLDYHKTYSKYLKTKSKLLLKSKLAMINRDDNSFKEVSKILKNASKKFVTYGLKYKSDFDINLAKKLDKPLANFNIYNFLAAYTAGIILNINENEILISLKSFKLPPGRLEVVYDKDFKVIIDFAHTPNAINQALKAIKTNYLPENGRLIHVFGSAGLRDKTKRGSMGEASGNYSDIVILTEEDYRTENPKIIASEIAKGLEKNMFKFIDPQEINKAKNRNFTLIIDREEAITAALHIAKKNDVVVTTGKAHEKSLCRGKIEYPWNEKKTIEKAIKSL